MMYLVMLHQVFFVPSRMSVEILYELNYCGLTVCCSVL